MVINHLLTGMILQVVFQPSLFGCDVSFREGICLAKDDCDSHDYHCYCGWRNITETNAIQCMNDDNSEYTDEYIKISQNLGFLF